MSEQPVGQPVAEALSASALFDEAAYLKRHPDIAQAVRDGQTPSGWAYYVNYGFVEQRLGPTALDHRVASVVTAKVPPGSPPPEKLRLRTHGSADLATFHAVGKRLALNLEAALSSLSVGLPAGSTILDFGCGCGRVLTWFRMLHPDAEFFATDIDREAIAWCRENLAAVATFSENDALPPLAYDSDFFDFIFSISIFTHLPEHMQFAWLRELHRVLKKGSWLILSVHGRAELEAPIYSARAREVFDTKGFCYGKVRATEGLPDFYQFAVHSEGYIRSRWAQFFRVVAIIGRGINEHQDMVICQKVA